MIRFHPNTSDMIILYFGNSFSYIYYLLFYTDGLSDLFHTAQKIIFTKSCNIIKSSKSPTKGHLSINFLAQKRPYLPSPKLSKQELSSNRQISFFHKPFVLKKGRISHLRKIQIKNFTVISKYQLFINFLAQKRSH